MSCVSPPFIWFPSVYKPSVSSVLCSALYMSLLSSCVCIPSFVWIKVHVEVYSSSLRASQGNRDRTLNPQRVSGTPSPPLYSRFLKVFLFPPFSSRGMETAARIIALARRDLPFVEFSREFCGLVAATAFDDTTILSLFWHGANFHRPVDLPDTTGLSWREGILRCLESVLPQARTSPPSSAALSRPPFAGKSRPPFAAPASPPPFAAHASPPPVGMASLPFAAHPSPVPAPQQHPPVPAPRQRPPVPAPRQRTTEPSSSVPASACPSKARARVLCCARSSTGPSSARTSRAPPSARASRAPPKCPRLQSPLKCLIEPLLSPRNFLGG